VNVSAETGKTLSTRNAILYLPPNALFQDELVRFIPGDQSIDYGLTLVGPAYEINPTEIELRKRGTLTIMLSAIEWQSILNKRELGIFRLLNSNTGSPWQAVRIGGSVNQEQQSITTAITEFGVYAVMTGESTAGELPTFIAELQCLPRAINPSGAGRRAETSITFSLGKPSTVSIRIYNPAGRLKRVLSENEFMQNGSNVIIWNGRDQESRLVASGIYIVCVEAEGEVATQPVLVVKD
jgi:hypothetical protein